MLKVVLDPNLLSHCFFGQFSHLLAHFMHLNTMIECLSLCKGYRVFPKPWLSALDLLTQKLSPLGPQMARGVPEIRIKFSCNLSANLLQIFMQNVVLKIHHAP